MKSRKFFTAKETLEIIEKLKTTASSKIARELKVGKSKIDKIIQDNKINYSIDQSRVNQLTKETINSFTKNSQIGNMRINKIIKQYNIINHTSCNRCNITNWFGEIITLELDHINGDNTDNTITNLRYLCPNCHSQTPNFRGRNLNKGKQKISEEKIVEAIKLYPNNIRKVLISVGLTPKGGNYDRIYKIKSKYNLQ